MKTATKDKNNKLIQQRNKYTAEHREKARKYYLLGLNLSEISKLLDGVPVRTLEKWQTADKWTAIKEVESIKTRALQLQEAGKTYQEIAELLQVNRTTVWRYVKQAKAHKV